VFPTSNATTCNNEFIPSLVLPTTRALLYNVQQCLDRLVDSLSTVSTLSSATLSISPYLCPRPASSSKPTPRTHPLHTRVHSPHSTADADASALNPSPTPSPSIVFSVYNDSSQRTPHVLGVCAAPLSSIVTEWHKARRCVTVRGVFA
jgi:hypothetical protein